MTPKQATDIVLSRTWEVPGYDQAKDRLHVIGYLEVATDMTMQIVPVSMGDVEICNAIATILNNTDK